MYTHTASIVCTRSCPYLLFGPVSRCDALRARRGGGLPGGGGALLAEPEDLRLSPTRRRVDPTELPPPRSTESPTKFATWVSRLRAVGAAEEQSLVAPELNPVVDTVAITLLCSVCYAPASSLLRGGEGRRPTLKAGVFCAGGLCSVVESFPWSLSTCSRRSKTCLLCLRCRSVWWGRRVRQ